MAVQVIDYEEMYGNTDDIEGVFNYNLAIVKLITEPAVLSVEATPPASPNDGDTYAIDANATGEWTGYSGYLAYASVGPNAAGTSTITWLLYKGHVAATSTMVYFWNGSQWATVGGGGGATYFIDTTNHNIGTITDIDEIRTAINTYFNMLSNKNAQVRLSWQYNSKYYSAMLYIERANPLDESRIISLGACWWIVLEAMDTNCYAAIGLDATGNLPETLTVAYRQSYNNLKYVSAPATFTHPTDAYSYLTTQVQTAYCDQAGRINWTHTIEFMSAHNESITVDISKSAVYEINCYTTQEEDPSATTYNRLLTVHGDDLMTTLAESSTYTAYMPDSSIRSTETILTNNDTIRVIVDTATDKGSVIATVNSYIDMSDNIASLADFNIRYSATINLPIEPTIGLQPKAVNVYVERNITSSDTILVKTQTLDDYDMPIYYEYEYDMTGGKCTLLRSEPVTNYYRAQLLTIQSADLSEMDGYIEAYEARMNNDGSPCKATDVVLTFIGQESGQVIFYNETSTMSAKYTRTIDNKVNVNIKYTGINTNVAQPFLLQNIEYQVLDISGSPIRSIVLNEVKPRVYTGTIKLTYNGTAATYNMLTIAMSTYYFNWSGQIASTSSNPNCIGCNNSTGQRNLSFNCMEQEQYNNAVWTTSYRARDVNSGSNVLLNSDTDGYNYPTTHFTTQYKEINSGMRMDITGTMQFTGSTSGSTADLDWTITIY